MKIVTAVNGKGRGKLKDVIINMGSDGVTVGSVDDAPGSVLLPVETAVIDDKPAVRGVARVHSQRIDWIVQMVKRVDGRVKLAVNEDRTLLRINGVRDDEISSDERLAYYLTN